MTNATGRNGNHRRPVAPNVTEDGTPVRSRSRADMDRAVERQRQNDEIARQAATPGPFDFAAIYDNSPAALPSDVAARCRHIQQRDPSYLKEFVLNTLHQMLLTQMPLDLCAQKFGVSLMQVMRWRTMLKKRRALDAMRFDPFPFIGEVMGHYKQVRAAGWQMYVQAGGNSNQTVRARGLDIALRANGEMARFMDAAGMLESVRVNASSNKAAEADLKEVKALFEMAEEVLRGKAAPSLSADTIDIDGDDDDFLEIL